MSDLSTQIPSGIRSDLLEGKPIIVYDFDGREEEADMVFYAGAVTWKSINMLRKEAGGLICYVMGKREMNEIGLSFLADEWRAHPLYHDLVKRPAYGDFPSFTMWVNHISVSTGISDMDRAKTITALHNLTADHITNKEEYFLKNFYAPGHVPILASRGLETRKGHTELVTRVAEILDLPRSMVIAEMLDDGKSLKREKARAYAQDRNIKFIEGNEILRV